MGFGLMHGFKEWACGGVEIGMEIGKGESRCYINSGVGESNVEELSSGVGEESGEGSGVGVR